MNIDEIITNPPRDEYIDKFSSDFDDAPVVAKIKDLKLKKSESLEEIQYGLFDNHDRLVGYFSLYYYGDGIWEVSLVQLAQAYKGFGYGTFLYDYAIMNDKLKVLSDSTNTGGPHGSQKLWKSLYNKKRYPIVGYNTKTKQIMKDITPDQVYNQTSNIRWLALPSDKTINESITDIQKIMKNRYVVWYGPGTTTEDYFNF
tara:strand:+ start:262 stop:861 length:600 start_codon:yes stop_codon:yes gene_type:complete